MKNKIIAHLVFVGFLFLFSCISLKSFKLERREFKSNELRIDGFYFSRNSGRGFFFYRNGITIGDMAVYNSIHSFVSFWNKHGKGSKVVSGYPPHYGIFKIEQLIILNERWTGGDGGYGRHLFKGFICNYSGSLVKKNIL